MKDDLARELTRLRSSLREGRFADPAFQVSGQTLRELVDRLALIIEDQAHQLDQLRQELQQQRAMQVHSAHAQSRSVGIPSCLRPAAV